MHLNDDQNHTHQQNTTSNNNKYRRLRDNSYLDDIVINDTLQQLFQNHTTKEYVNTYFMPNIKQQNNTHGAVQRGLRKLQQTNIKEWFIPVHSTQHWLFLHVHKQTKKITQYDSLLPSTEHYGTYLIQFMERNTGTQWTLCTGNMRQQQNHYDCGAYMLAEIQTKLQNLQLPLHWRPNRDAIFTYLTQGIHSTFYQEVTKNNRRQKLRSPENKMDKYNIHSTSINRKQETNSLHLQRQNKITDTTETRSKTPRTTSTHNHKRKQDKPSTMSDDTTSKETHTTPTDTTPLTQTLDNDIHKGHKMQPKDKQTIQIYTQNIDGISTKNTEDHFHHILTSMADRDVDVMGFAETNIEWNDPVINSKLYKIMKQHFPGGNWKPSTSNIQMETIYKPGGNLIVTNKSIRSRTLHTEADNKGRWAWQVLYGSDRPITIIQAYFPHKNKGIYSAYAQQHQQIQQEKREINVDVHQQYFNDLNKVLEQQKHTNIILMGDFNQESDNTEISHLQAQHNLCDVYDTIHPGQKFSTHNQGSTRIDYMLIS